MIRFLRNVFFQDLWLKLFSLTLAVLTWLTVWFAIQKETSPAVVLANTKEREFLNLPVIVLSSASDVHDFRVDPKEVHVIVQGDAQTLSRVKSTDIRPIVDVTGIPPIGDVHRRIEVSTPPGVSHVRVMPEDVLVIFPTRR